MELILATSNVHKIREFRDMIRIPDLDLLSLLQFPQYLPPEETGETFEQNAIKKAEHAAKTLGKWALADDSGLVVPSLNQAPGVLSKRYASPSASDSDNRKKLLEELSGKSHLERSAYYHSALAIAHPEEGVKKVVTGLCEGMIIEQEKGGNGFGYDPLFMKFDYDVTFAQLDETTKNRISHRRKAVDKFLPFLEQILRESLVKSIA